MADTTGSGLVAVHTDAELGESPTWDLRSQTLLWVDILRSRSFQFDPRTGYNTVTEYPQHIGAAKPRTRGGLVLNLRDGIALADSSGALSWLVYWARDGVRGNDAGVDPSGRLWVGTMRYDTAEGGGSLLRVAPDGAVTTILPRVTTSSGVAWSPDRTLMYYIDSAYRRVDVFDYDDPTGDVQGRRLFTEVLDTDGVPEGLCVDADGCPWVAINGGGVIRRYTPNGVLDRELSVPVTRPTACCFGGPSLTDLYVTTAREQLTETELSEQSPAGSLFCFPDVGQGLPSPIFTG
jgi:sugar lactone lactonase YvrE